MKTWKIEVPAMGGKTFFLSPELFIERSRTVDDKTNELTAFRVGLASPLLVNEGEEFRIRLENDVVTISVIRFEGLK